MKKPGPADFEHVQSLSVRLDFHGQSLQVGTLAWDRTERRAYFEYHRDFLNDPVPLSPFRLAAKEGAIAAPYEPFGGLHGLFNDSLPDGWGRLLLDRSLRKLDYNYRLLTPLDRLAHVGLTGVGALRYVPNRSHLVSDSDHIDLDWLASQATAVQAEVEEAEVDRLLEIQGGSAGARPKIMIGRNAATGGIVADAGSGLRSGYEAWMLKFSASQDPAEIGPEEYAYSLMAGVAGVVMPPTRLVETAKGRYFAVKRFDRTPDGNAHVQTASGLLDADHRAPSIDYEALLKATRLLTRDERQVRQMFTRMVFNVFAFNRDDHAKNHAFLLSRERTWEPTPAYDITLSDGPGGEHSLSINGEGRKPSIRDIMLVAEKSSIPKTDAAASVDAVRTAIGRWPAYASQAGISDRRTKEIDRLLNRSG